MLTRVPRQSLSQSVFEQLRDQIVRGEMHAGSPVPAERILCEALGVNRGAIREALRRLEQAGLISVRHGGASTILDYRDSAGLDLLPHLLVRGGEVDLAVLRSIVEMRTAIAADVARLAASRRQPQQLRALRKIALAMERDAKDVSALQDRVSEFWSVLVDAADNLAYRLAFNSLRASYDESKTLFAGVLAGEVGDLPAYTAIIDVVQARDAERAEGLAADLVRGGERAIVTALEKAQ